MKLRAFEQWLDEGWSPWRIWYGIANLIALAVTVYGYVRQPHHPGAVWWLLAAVAIIALWAFGEMMRWRVKYRRLLSAQQATLSAPPPRVLPKLLTEGQGLLADVATHMSLYGTDRPSPRGLTGRIVRWEGSVSEKLVSHPEIRALFRDSPAVDMNGTIIGQVYGRLEYDVKILESAIDDATGDLNADSLARVKSGEMAYYADRLKRLQEVYKEGRSLRSYIESYDHIDAIPLIRRIDKWDKGARDVLKYWPDLNRFGLMPGAHSLGTPNLHDFDERVRRELDALQTAMTRLRQ